MKIRTLVFAAVLLAPAFGLADSKGEKLSDSDAQVIAHIHAVNQMEIDLGKLAQKNATDPVKSYGSTLVKDHSSADKDLTAFAKSHGIAKIPDDKSMSDDDKKMMKDEKSKLKNLKGADFDREYLGQMVTGHETELAKLDSEIAGSIDKDLSTMLQSLKPVLQRHEDEAKKLQNNAPAAMR